MAGKQEGTGKHPHKSTEEPYPHTKDQEQDQKASSSHAGSKPGSSQGGQSSSGSDLKQREYRDEQGNVHHHTHTYEQQHGKK